MDVDEADANDYSFDEDDVVDVNSVMMSEVDDCAGNGAIRKLSGAFASCTKTESHMRVFLRIRPISTPTESTIVVENDTTIITSAPESSKRAQYTKMEERTYTFNRVFDTIAKQEEVYDHTVAPLMARFLEGNNCVLFAYGMTNAGKTYTIQGTPLDQGLFPRIINYLLTKYSMDQNDFKISMLEIYQEKIFDLLSKKKDSLNLREGAGKSVEVLKLSNHSITSVQQVVQLLDLAASKRSKSTTMLNSGSSRSHAVYTLSFEKNGVLSTFQVVDLAGAERGNRTKATIAQQKEANNINVSLMKLWRCLQGMKKKNTAMESTSGLDIIPYRESKLTHMLMPNIARAGLLGVAMITCVNPHIEDYDETISILGNASLACKIREIAEFRPPTTTTTACAPFSRSAAHLEKIEAAKEKNSKRKRPVDTIATTNQGPTAAAGRHKLLSSASKLSKSSSHADSLDSMTSFEESVKEEGSQWEDMEEMRRLKQEIDRLLQENRMLQRDQLTREAEIRCEVSEEMAERSAHLLTQIQELQSQLNERTTEYNDVTRSCKKARRKQVEKAQDEVVRDLHEAEEEIHRLKTTHEIALRELREENCRLEDELHEWKEKTMELQNDMMELKSRLLGSLQGGHRTRSSSSHSQSHSHSHRISSSNSSSSSNQIGSGNNGVISAPATATATATATTKTRSPLSPVKMETNSPVMMPSKLMDSGDVLDVTNPLHFGSQQLFSKKKCSTSPVMNPKIKRNSREKKKNSIEILEMPSGVERKESLENQAPQQEDVSNNDSTKSYFRKLRSHFALRV